MSHRHLASRHAALHPAALHPAESDHSPQAVSLTRRAFSATLATCAAAFALPGMAAARVCAGKSAASNAAGAEHTHDWQWLVGNWDVWHQRLRERLANDTHWDEFAGKSACWLTMGGLGTIDDNLLELPGGTYRALGIRAFNAQTGKWAIWWLDGRNPTSIEPPVMGGFDSNEGLFAGRDTFKGRPITMRFRWHDIHGAKPNWDQAFSTDDGATWEINWRNYFTRTAATPTPLPRLADANHDWDFLVGSWSVRHRRLRHRLVGNKDWDEFGGSLVNWPVLGGFGNVGDNVMEFPGGTVRGVGIRAFDPASAQWSSWWLDLRSPTAIDAPVRGGFKAGIGTFVGDDTLDGRPIKTRVQWSGISANTARWEQSCSADGGATWESNWVSEFSRKA